MSFQPAPRDTPKPPKGKVKGARRVINLSEEQRRKKRENDRLAQQNIRRKNKETIDNLRSQVAMLQSMEPVQTALRLAAENRALEARVLELSRHIAHMYNERHSNPPTLEVDFSHGPRAIPTNHSGLSCIEGPSPAAGHSDDYSTVPHDFGPPSLSSTHRYDQWPSHVVPVPSPAAIHSAKSSPGPSGPSEGFGYLPTSLPVMEPAIIASTTSAPAPDPIKLESREADTVASAASGYPSPKDSHSSPAYLHPPSLVPAYSGNCCYPTRAPHRLPVPPTPSQVCPTMHLRDGRAGEFEQNQDWGEITAHLAADRLRRPYMYKGEEGEMPSSRFGD